jgi:hypothetical protein
MKSSLAVLIALLGVLLSRLSAQQPAQKKPPIGVPADATLFNGKWCRTYLEKATWQQARDKSRTLGGQLVCIEDAPTQTFLAEFSKGLELWIGVTDEKVEGLWVWVNGNEMKYAAWDRGEPNGGRRENYATMKRRAWNDVPDHTSAVGFICEWKDK